MKITNIPNKMMIFSMDTGDTNCSSSKDTPSHQLTAHSAKT